MLSASTAPSSSFLFNQLYMQILTPSSAVHGSALLSRISNVNVISSKPAAFLLCSDGRVIAAGESCTSGTSSTSGSTTQSSSSSTCKCIYVLAFCCCLVYVRVCVHVCMCTDMCVHVYVCACMCVYVCVWCMRSLAVVGQAESGLVSTVLLYVVLVGGR